MYWPKQHFFLRNNTQIIKTGGQKVTALLHYSGEIETVIQSGEKYTQKQLFLPLHNSITITMLASNLKPTNKVSQINILK